MKKTKKLTFIVMLTLALFVGAYTLHENSTGRLKFTGSAQQVKPKCTCWFPEDKKYGVLSEKEGCKIVDCEPPPPKQPTKP